MRLFGLSGFFLLGTLGTLRKEHQQSFPVFESTVIGFYYGLMTASRLISEKFILFAPESEVITYLAGIPVITCLCGAWTCALVLGAYYSERWKLE